MLRPSGDVGDERVVIFLAQRIEEFLVTTLSSNGLTSYKKGLYWVETGNEENVIEHLEYKYNEHELESIAQDILKSDNSDDKERLNARLALTFLAFKNEIFAENPDPWVLAAHAAALATVAPTPKQRTMLDSKNAQTKGKKGGSRPKKNKALQEVILSIVRDMVGAGEKTSIKAVWEHLASHESFCPHETGSEGCDHLYVDGDTLFWTDYSQDGITESKKKRSLEPYIKKAKQKLSKSPQ